MRDTLETYQRMTRKTPAELIGPDCPEDLRYLWDWFIQIAGKRQSGFGYSPITSEEMYRFFELRRITLEPFEAEVLDSLDAVAIEILGATKPPGPRKPQPSSKG